MWVYLMLYLIMLRTYPSKRNWGETFCSSTSSVLSTVTSLFLNEWSWFMCTRFKKLICVKNEPGFRQTRLRLHGASGVRERREMEREGGRKREREKERWRAHEIDMSMRGPKRKLMGKRKTERKIRQIGRKKEGRRKGRKES